MFFFTSRWVWWFLLTVRTQYHATSSSWHDIEKPSGAWSANMECYAESSASISRVNLVALKHWICRTTFWLPRGQNRICSASTSFIWYRNISVFLEIQSKRSSYPVIRIIMSTWDKGKGTNWNTLNAVLSTIILICLILRPFYMGR